MLIELESFKGQESCNVRVDIIYTSKGGYNIHTIDDRRFRCMGKKQKFKHYVIYVVLYSTVRYSSTLPSWAVAPSLGKFAGLSYTGPVREFVLFSALHDYCCTIFRVSITKEWLNQR